MKKIFAITLIAFFALFTNLNGQTTWTGNVNTDWNNSGNWDNGNPAPGNNATVPSGTPFNPAIGTFLVAQYDILNYGNIFSNSGIIFNNGNITNNGSITLTVGQINNGGNIVNNGDLTSKFWLNNGNVVNLGNITNNGGQFQNYGNIDNFGNITINGIFGSTSNFGNIVNIGDIVNNNTFNNEEFGFFNNLGEINNNGNINNSGDFDNNGNIDNNSAIFNSGDFDNNGNFDNDNGSFVNISEIDNLGLIFNDNNGIIINFGIIDNIGSIFNCSGTYNGTLPIGNPLISPNTIEVCDGIDNNCDGNIDGFDLDNDGVTTCEGDCNDLNPLVNPDAEEICDGKDNNCDGSIDEGFDDDGDGTANCFDGCPDDPNKTSFGVCGCGNPDPGTLCDDGDPLTIRDVIQNYCACEGVLYTPDDVSISDPCTCLNNASTGSDGQFHEIIEVDAPAGQTWTVVSAPGLYLLSSPPPPAAPIPVAAGTVLTYNSGTAMYEQEGIHIDGLGYNIVVTNGTDVLGMTNQCHYPKITFDIGAYISFADLPTAASALTEVINVASGNPALGSGTFLLLDSNGDPVPIVGDELPATLNSGELYTLVYEFTEDAQPIVPPGPNTPGCTQEMVTQFLILSVGCE